tara:strand:+ start:9242 stop:9490 length:249 start_codon:yes stop_codon:yes gene_type:complete
VVENVLDDGDSCGDDARGYSEEPGESFAKKFCAQIFALVSGGRGGEKLRKYTALRWPSLSAVTASVADLPLDVGQLISSDKL